MDLAQSTLSEEFERQLGLEFLAPAPSLDPSPAPARATEPAASRKPEAAPARRTGRPVFAGLSKGQLAALASVLLALAWGAWMTRAVIVLQHKRVVTVRLSQLISDFVTTEARSGDSQTVAAQRTQAYMLGLDAVMKKHASDGSTVLVGEAVIAGTVPDITPQVNAEVAKLVALPAPAAPLAASGAVAPVQQLPSSPLTASPSVTARPVAPLALPPAASAPTAPVQADPFAGVSAPDGTGE